MKLTSMAFHGAKLKRALLYRLYLLLMRGESLNWIPVRRSIVNQLLGRKHVNLNIFPYVFIEGIDGLRLGDNVSINRSCNISAFGGLAIGDDVSIGHSTSILTTEHRFSDRSRPIKEQSVSHAAVTISDNVWIGARVCILSGVTLARGTIVAAGAVVKHSVAEENCTVGGVPARLLKRR